MKRGWTLGEETEVTAQLRGQKMELNKYRKIGKATERLQSIWERWQRKLYQKNKFKYIQHFRRLFRSCIWIFFLEKRMTGGSTGFLTPPATATDWHSYQQSWQSKETYIPQLAKLLNIPQIITAFFFKSYYDNFGPLLHLHQHILIHQEIRGKRYQSSILTELPSPFSWFRVE